MLEWNNLEVAFLPEQYFKCETIFSGYIFSMLGITGMFSAVPYEVFPDNQKDVAKSKGLKSEALKIFMIL
ncbi:hypothetical protein [Kosmotoga olearia]|uniref:Uncharacterized protein n=1 Tax=Kosmotoga olearia (strain ATCC BAA-1733 / DSM 21960 / TBF 19.5.1) TaxID=521045 RepID=C5CIZ8_KOSOT|nr:hypothetical protein [Kosmotoga olearia]ACR79914.1 hypothetical protein Kole_1217 [Kosmotoga olearia TBF 19.5.1]